jgi:4-hydroxy-tetrahydrodipicolinate synthase
LLAAGVKGFFLLGTTGLGADSSMAERMRVLEQVLRVVDTPQRIVVAVSANAADDVRALAEHALAQGVQGIALTPPFYGLWSDAEIEAWATQIFRDWKKRSHLYLYNIPWVTHSRWSLASLDAVHALVGVDGIKDSSGDLAQLDAYLAWAHRHQAAVLTGTERLIAYNYLRGGTGAVSGLASAFPDLIVRLATLSDRRDWTQALTVQEEVNQILADLAQLSLREIVQWITQKMQDHGILQISPGNAHA